MFWYKVNTTLILIYLEFRHPMNQFNEFQIISTSMGELSDGRNFKLIILILSDAENSSICILISIT